MSKRTWGWLAIWGSSFACGSLSAASPSPRLKFTLIQTSTFSQALDYRCAIYGQDSQTLIEHSGVPHARVLPRALASPKEMEALFSAREGYAPPDVVAIRTVRAFRAEARGLEHRLLFDGELGKRAEIPGVSDLLERISYACANADGYPIFVRQKLGKPRQGEVASLP